MRQLKLTSLAGIALSLACITAQAQDPFIKAQRVSPTLEPVRLHPDQQAEVDQRLKALEGKPGANRTS